MYHHLLQTMLAEVSGPGAHRLTAQIAQHHRIQASPMYRAAAEWLHATLRGWGLAAELEACPTDEGLLAWGEPLFQEWSCAEGRLELLAEGGPLPLADYAAMPLALMPRSAPADGVFELAVLSGGDRAEDYAAIDVRGKIVLSDRSPTAVQRLAVERFGAAGVIFDGMRSIAEICPPGDLPDAVQYASWWWYGGETRCFGFALSPRAGADLRRRAARSAAPLRLRATVRSQLGPGAIELVSALIPGETAEEVLLIAHLCHPAPCANDNASGAAAAMEIARTLQRLIARGALPRPRRGIRFLWVPEMTGTYLYLARHAGRIPQTVAALNLDMVGADQAQTGSVNTIIRPSDALPSFVAELLMAIRDGLAGPAHQFAGQSEPALLRQAVAPISNGSDHYILGDPSVGIPTPLIIEWPDRFYHTSADTIDKVSPATLRRNMAVAATYLALLAGAGAAEASWLAHELNARLVGRLSHELQSALGERRAGLPAAGAPWPERVAFRLERHALALADLRRLDPDFDPAPHQRAAAAAAAAIWAPLAAELADHHAAGRADMPAELAGKTLRRRHRGPLSLRPHIQRLPAAERAAALEQLRALGPYDGLAGDLALYWADGRRTLAAILAAVELESDVRDPAGLAVFAELLERLGLAEVG